MTVEMADMTIRAPLGIVENIIVKIDNFLFPFDLGIIDMLGEPDETIILGRPFLATIHAQIDVFKRENSVGIGEEGVKFNMNRGISHSGIPVEKIYMASSVHEKEYFNSLETEKRLRYGNKVIDDTTRKRRYYEWVAQNTKFNDNGISHEATMYDNSCKYHHEYPQSYFPQESKSMPKPMDTVKDIFDVEVDFGKTRYDLYSRRFDEYNEEFNTKIEELANEYDLRVGRKRYALDDVWEKCEKFHPTSYLWHDEGSRKKSNEKVASRI
nr:hypothetical protein [Tanacetum cinerariifolium]